MSDEARTRSSTEADDVLFASLHFIAEEKSGDLEVAHAMMDQAIIDRLRALGYRKSAEFYEAQKKWYA